MIPFKKWNRTTHENVEPIYVDVDMMLKGIFK